MLTVPAPQLMSQPQYVPLVMHFLKLHFTSHFSSGFAVTPDLHLPLIALQYHEVKINLELRPQTKFFCLLFPTLRLVQVCKLQVLLMVHLSKTEPHTKNLWLPHPSMLTTFSLIPMSVDAWHKTHTNTLIEQLQFTGDESVGSSSNKVKLNFNHPCKEIIFVVQPDKNVDYCQSFLKDMVLNRALGAQPFQLH